MAKFKRYDSYKNSGVEWLGEIPIHWEIVRLGSKFIERKEKVSDKDFKPLSVTKTGVVPQLDSAAKTDDGDNRKLVRKDDFVINSRSDRKGSSGLSKFEGSVSLINIVLKPLDINLEYSNFMLKCNGFIEEFYRNGHGIVADLWTTRFWDMKSIMLPIPPKDEQEKIALYLDEKIAKIDASISGKEKFIELLKEQKQIIINDAVTKGLNKNAKFKNSGVEWLGQIPSHWEVIRLGSLGIFSKGNGISRNELVADGIPAILYGDIYTKYNYQAIEIKNFISTETSLKAVKISENDILLTGSGETKDDIGKCVVFKGKEAFAGGDIIIFKQDKNNSTFLAYSLNSSYSIMQKTIMAKGEIIVHIYSSMLKELLLPLPPKDEQEKIVEYIENKISKIDKLINLEQECIKSLKEYKASLIDSVVTGKVKV
jgi:hypothetical protein